MENIKQVYDASAQKCYPIVKLDCITDKGGIYDASSGIDVIVGALEDKELTVSALYVNDGTDENDVTIKNNFFEIENIIKIDDTDIVSYDKPLKIYKTNSKTFSLLDSSGIQVGHHNIKEPFGIAEYTNYRLESTDKSFGLLCKSGEFVSGIYSDGKSIKIQNVDAGRPIGMYTDFGPYDVFFKRKTIENDTSRDASVFSISTIAGPNISQVKSYVDTFVHGILSIRPEERTKDTRISLHVDTSLGVTKGGYLDIKYDASTKINIYSERTTSTTKCSRIGINYNNSTNIDIYSGRTDSTTKGSRIGINYDNSTNIDIYSEVNDNIKQSRIGLKYDASTNVNMFALGSPDGRYGSLYINSDDSTKINMSSVINSNDGRRESSIGILSDASTNVNMFALRSPDGRYGSLYINSDNSTKINMSSVINSNDERRESSIGILSDASTKINMNTCINDGIRESNIGILSDASTKINMSSVINSDDKRRESSIGILSDASTKIEMNTYSKIDTPNSGISNLGVYYDTSTKTIISADSSISRIGINYDNSTKIDIYSKSYSYYYESGLKINAKASKIAMTSLEAGGNRTSKLAIISNGASGCINILSGHSVEETTRNSITSVGSLLNIDSAVQFNKAISTSVFLHTKTDDYAFINSNSFGIYDDELRGYNAIHINNRTLYIVRKNPSENHFMKHFIIYNRIDGVDFYLGNSAPKRLQPDSFYLVVLGRKTRRMANNNKYVYTNNLILKLDFAGSYDFIINS